jgi:agmatine deiminase
MTPRESKFRMPAEWEPHEGTWLAWPHEKSDWPGKFAPIPWLYGEIVRHLARVERVFILVNDEPAERAARKILRTCHANLAAVDFFHHPTNRSWTRDFCPLFVRNKTEIAITHWRFNGWAKYSNYEFDSQVPHFLALKLAMERWAPDIVLEGGSIDVNGAGLLLTTEECLLSDVQARNPSLSKREIERAMKDYLGIRQVIWLGRGIAGDDTHGHVDDLARFTSRDTVVTVVEPDKSELNHEPLKENLARLRSFQGDLHIATLPMPEPIHFAGQRLPASYANFYIANQIVLVPIFGDPNDRVALNTLARLFPSRQVIGIYSRDLVLGLGTLHCMTMQQPI